MKGDRTPEQLRLHLHRNMPWVVGVPDPDVSTILHDTLFGCRLHLDGLERAGGRLDLFAALDLHPDGYRSHGIGQRKRDDLPDVQRLRLRIEDRRKRIGHAGGNIRLLVSRRALHQVALILYLLAASVVETQLAGNLATAFLDLLIEAGRATGLPVEAGLKAIDYGEQHVHRSDGIRRG